MRTTSLSLNSSSGVAWFPLRSKSRLHLLYGSTTGNSSEVCIIWKIGALHLESNPRVPAIEVIQPGALSDYGSFKEAKSANAGAEEIQDSAQSS